MDKKTRDVYLAIFMSSREFGITPTIFRKNPTEYLDGYIISDLLQDTKTKLCTNNEIKKILKERRPPISPNVWELEPFIELLENFVKNSFI